LVLTETRGTEEMPALHNVKMRVDKDFPFGRQGMRLRLSLDVQNLFNVDTPNDIQNNSSVDNYYTGVGHVGVLNVVSPRQAQVGIRFEF
jgi:outer membrane receptor protein involved in Fe transport